MKKSYLILLIFICASLILAGIYLLLNHNKIPKTTFNNLPLIHRTNNVYLDIPNDNIYQILLAYFNQNQNDFTVITDKLKADIIINNEEDDNGEIIFSEPLVATINPNLLIDNIDLNSIKNSINQITIEGYSFDKIVANKHYKNYIVQHISGGDTQHFGSLDNDQGIVDMIQQDKKTIGLLPLSKLEITLHPLKIDNNDVFTNPEKYPLRINTYIHGIDKEAIKKLTESVDLKKTNKPITSILAVGDIMMGRYVAVKINQSGNPSHSFEYVSEYLSKPDLTFANLEAPFSGNAPYVSDGMILVAQKNSIKGLIDSGIDLVTISSNHFGDGGQDTMQETFSILEKNKIAYVGAGNNEKNAFDYKIIEKNNVKISFLSFGSIMPDSYGAGEDYPGTAWINLSSDNDLRKVSDTINKAKSITDVLIVCFHWGTEYTPDPTLDQIKFAHAAIDAGADLIVGTHPHVVQANEIYRGKYIIYSQGNFIMDQMWSQETQEGVIMPIYLYGKKIISIDLIPTKIVDYSQTKIISKTEGKTILERIWNASLKINNPT